MGSEQSKDPSVDMVIQTSQKTYTPGSYVEGIVHINCRNNINYNVLRLRLKGVDHVHWTQQSDKQQINYSNTKVTYNSSFSLVTFPQNVLQTGHYSFPFKFLLPAEITGTYFESQNTYIRYQLIAELIPSGNQNQVQTFVKNLNILEPCRQITGPIQKQQINNPSCCFYCKSYGNIKVTMQCDKNFVQSGDKISVKVLVDNSEGKQEVTGCELDFVDFMWKIASNGVFRQKIPGSYPLSVHPDPILPGQKKELSFNVQIPQNLKYSTTAIGSVLARYHVLSFIGWVGCCSPGIYCQFLLVFNSKTPFLEVGPQVPIPPGWNPKVADEVLHTNFPPFNYQPNSGIPYVNRKGMSNVANLKAMINQNEYHNQSSQNFTAINSMEKIPRFQ